MAIVVRHCIACNALWLVTFCGD